MTYAAYFEVPEISSHGLRRGSADGYRISNVGCWIYTGARKADGGAHTWHPIVWRSMLVEIGKDQCHAKVSIGGIDDMLFEEGRSASGVSEKAPHSVPILLLMPDFADNPCGRHASQQSLHAHTLSLLRHSERQVLRPTQDMLT
jgi:hypothetical protein